MNDIGLTLAWLAVQVALVLGPAVILHALASRREPAAGAWVAALSLGLVVGLSVSAFLPRGERVEQAPALSVTPAGAAHHFKPSAATAAGADAVSPSGGRLVLDLEGLRRIWARLERGASAPAARCRPWGSALAALALAGTGAGMLHLALGLWAIGLCRRSGRPVDDPGMTGLLEALRGAMGCRARVALVEVRDLTTPATAGWRRPVILLPAGWRSWDESERRAVLAHELAHVVRGDYAAGLVARLALALNTFHPLVRWMAGRMQMQQELAADALGARYAGGRACYLVALSQLVLEQDGRSPSWPARAFLPRRGALIRRIAMLRNEDGTEAQGPAWSRAGRLMTVVTLLGLTIAVGTLRGPARGAEDGTPAPAKAVKRAPVGGDAFPHRTYENVVTTVEESAPEDRVERTSPAPLYLRDGKDGVIVVRPAALCRRNGIAALVTFVTEIVGIELREAVLAKEFKVDTSRPGFLKLDYRDIEWVTLSLGFGHAKNSEKEDVHSFMVTNPVVRTVAPFDWLAFLRQWRFEFEEVRVEKGVYYRIKGPLRELVGRDPCVCLPDDRTILLDDESTIRTLVGVPPTTPSYLRGPDWEGASRGLLAIAIKNPDETFVKRYDLGRPDDAVVLSLFQGVDRWVFSVQDTEEIALNAYAVCRDRAAREAIVRTIGSLEKLWQDAVERPAPQTTSEADDRAGRMAKALTAHLTILSMDKNRLPNFPPMDNLVAVRSHHFGTLADFAAILMAEAKEGSRKEGGKEGANDSKQVRGPAKERRSGK